MKQQIQADTGSTAPPAPPHRAPPPADGVDFLAGGGVMGARMRALDWSVTPLGPPQFWPQSLKAVVRVVLTSRFAMWMAWGPDLTFFCNDAYLPTTGLKRDRVLGERTDRVWAEIWPDIGPRIQHVLDTGQATWDEQLLLYLERSGYPEESYHTFSYSPLADDAGATVGMLCVVAEVTDRVINERQLATLRDLGARLSASSTRNDVMRALESCLSASPRDMPFALAYLMPAEGGDAELSAVHGIDAAGAGLAQRVKLRELAAFWPVEKVLAERTAELVAVPPGLTAGLALTYWQHAPEKALVYPILRGEGEAPAGILIAGLNPHRGLDSGYSGFISLMTGQIAAAIARADEYERARARAEALAELDRAKTAFFSNVSHEFRTPLTLLLGPLEDALAEAATLPLAQAERVEIAYRNGQRLLRLVNTLLDFSRIEAGRVAAQFQATALESLTADLGSTFRSAFERAGLTLEMAMHPMGGPVFVDRDMWEKIVLNLLSNAFKFTLHGGVALRLGAQDGLAVLEIEDTGTGIPAEELPNLFDRFHRVAGARGRSFEGSGIGLALVHELVRLHGGTITVRSVVDRGTTFRVSIPLGTAHLPPGHVGAGMDQVSTATRAQAFVDEALRWLPESAPASSEVIADLDSEKPGAEALHGGVVLLADDNADLRDYVRRLLEGRGYRVEAVADGQAALQAAQARRPDLLLTDVMMPQMDGFALLAAIRGDPALADLPVIMLSARAGEEAQVEGLDAGADDYLAKPFSARELLARVAANLDMSRVRRNAAEALRASRAQLLVEREFLASVLAKAPIGISIVDADGRTLMLNERGVGLIGHRYEAGGPADYGMLGAIHLDGRPYASDEYPTLRALHGERVERERVVYLRGGAGGTERIVLEVDSEPILDATGAPAGAVTVFNDAGERERAEAELRQRVADAVAEREAALAQLHEVAKLETIGQLTGGVAHDFNNLLTPIIGSLDMLRRRIGSDERSRRHIDAALQAAERSRILVQRLLSFARRQNLAARPVDVSHLVVGMQDFLQRTLGPAIRLILDMSGDAARAMVDPNQLELAILNLCVNARDAMPDGGTLTIGIDTVVCQDDGEPGLAAGDYVVLAVTDTGTGMDAATLRRAVEPFFTTKETGRGTGLGLSMVHGLAGQSNGAFRLRSEPGSGTSAMLWLPVATEPVAAAPDEIPQAVSQARTATILLIDDEAIVRETTSRMLADLGYTVLEASAGEEALAIARARADIDAVVTDFRMPGMNGLELSRAMQSLRPGLPILLITGFASASDKQAIKIPQLAKPFRQTELAARVAELLDRG